ncbi:MAG TPA: ribonuclease Z [Acidimicrobiales bacterium]|nr:ribonuclease Z [Acidimicrobiales bacterium]
MRELVVLGTASQAPTRYRNHNGYFLRWDDEGILFDPGEGTQRQMLHAGVRSSSITRICITHFHGDHCLGLPGVVQRLSLDEVAHRVSVYFPRSGQGYAERLLDASVFDHHTELRLRPVSAGETVEVAPPFALRAERLDHEPDTLGWRIEELDGRTMVPALLQACGVEGPDVGRLLRQGELHVPGRERPVRVEEVSVRRRGQVMAFVMDTGLCDAAFALAEEADLLVCEATFAEAEAHLAKRFHHLTAAQAGRLAAESGARRLVITHFSQRYPDARVLEREAAGVFDDVVCAEDLLRVAVPLRRSFDAAPEPGAAGSAGV